MGFYHRLVKAGFSSYDEYLASPQWTAFKHRYREAGLPLLCAVCGCKPVQLHHHTYERLCAEDLTDVTPLCRTHHVQVHACLKTFGWAVLLTARAIARLRAGESFDVLLVTAPGKKTKTEKRREKKARKKAREERRADQLQERQAAKKVMLTASEQERRSQRKKVKKKPKPRFQDKAERTAIKALENRCRDLRRQIDHIPSIAAVDYRSAESPLALLRDIVTALLEQKRIEKQQRQHQSQWPRAPDRLTVERLSRRRLVEDTPRLLAQAEDQKERLRRLRRKK